MSLARITALVKSCIPIPGEYTAKKRSGCKIAYRQMLDNEKYGFHGFVAGGLIDSILASGDGTTPVTRKS